MVNRLGTGISMTSKPCIACAEDIKLEALLCKYCKTLQNDSEFVSSGSTKSRAATPNSKSERKLNQTCPKCKQVDSVQSVASIVDSGTINSSGFSVMSQFGNAANSYTGMSVSSSSSMLVDRLTIGIPEIEFRYRFVDFALGTFFAFGLFIGLVFKHGSPADSGPFNVGFAAICSLVLGPILGIYTASVRRKNQSEKLIPVQIALNNASIKLRQAHYCFRDDLVFDGQHFGDPETYIERLIAAEQ